MSNLPTLVCWMVLSSQQMRTGSCSPLIPYGPNVPADTYVALYDDDATKVILDVPLLFYGTTYTEAWVSTIINKTCSYVFVLFEMMLYFPVKKFSVKLRLLKCCSSTKRRMKRLAQGKTQCVRFALFTSEKPLSYHAWSCQNVCDALIFLLGNIFVQFSTKLYRQAVGLPMGNNCTPLIADLFFRGNL